MTRILITGRSGMLGREVEGAARTQGHEVHGLDRTGPDPCDITDAGAVHRRVAAVSPALIIHTAAWTAVDACETDPERADAVNGGGTAHVARAAEAVGAHLVHVSTDYVFDGTKGAPYEEDDEPRPRSAYGRSKLLGEQAVGPSHAVVRTSWLYGPVAPSIVATILRQLGGSAPLRFVDDQIGNPTSATDLAGALLDLGLGGASGTWHVTNRGSASWWQLAREVARAAGEDPDRIHPIATADLDPPRAAIRPADSRLADDRWTRSGRAPLPDFRTTLERTVASLQATGATAPR